MFGAPNYATVNGGFRNLVKNNIIEFAKRYANAKLDEAAEVATCSDSSWTAMPEYTVDKYSILDLKDQV